MTKQIDVDTWIAPETLDTGATPEDLVTLKVKHDLHPENEILINADCWCDIGSHYVPEWMMTNCAGDASVCEDCFEHYN